MFHLSLLEFCITVLPFEPQGSQKVEDEPPYPSIRVKVVISVIHFITERQIRYRSVTLKISNLVIAIICQQKFTRKRTE